MAEQVTETKDEETKARLGRTNRFLQSAAYFIAATAKQLNLEILIIVTDKHESPAICMASSLKPEKQPELLLDCLMQMNGGLEQLSKLAQQMVEIDMAEEGATKQ